MCSFLLLRYIALFTFLKVWYIHFVFIIFVLECMVLQVVQVILLLVVLLLVGFGDTVMYDGALIRFKYEDDFGCCQ